MRARLRSRSAARWPFWLLLVAWASANLPQAATWTVLAWLHEARHFSHQQRLATDVTYLLRGEKAPGLLARTGLPPASPLPPLPPEVALRKMELAFDPVAELLPPELRAARPERVNFALPDTFRVAPPHEPPRTRFLLG